MWVEKLPCIVSPSVGSFAPDVAPPDHVGSGRSQGSGHAYRLGVVEEYDVAFSNPADETGDIRIGNPLVVLRLVGAEVSGVTGHPVDPVVDSLCDGEEVGVSGHDQPADVDASVLDIAHQDLEHFGNATSGGRRADIPDRSSLESLGGPQGCEVQFCEALSPNK